MKGLEAPYELKLHRGWQGTLTEPRKVESFNKTLHIFAKDSKQAERKARELSKRHDAHISSLVKMDIERGLYDVSNMKIELDDPRQSAIAMDELIAVKRVKRRDNLYKDKPID